MIQLFAATKCHVTPSWLKRFLKQIKRLKSLLQCCGSVCVIQDGRRSRRWIANVCFIFFFCVVWVLTASIFVYICCVDCCIAANC